MRRLQRIKIIILLLMQVYWLPGNTQNVVSLINDINECVAKYQFEEAEFKLKVLQKLNINDPKACLVLADWYYFKMDYEKSHELYTRVLNNDSLNTDAINGLAMIAFDFSDTEKAHRLLKHSLKIDSTKSISWINYSEIVLELRNIPQYYEALNKALKLDSLNTKAYAGLGYYWAALRFDIEKGAAYFNKAIEVDSLSKRAHHYLGRGYSPAKYDQLIPIENDTLQTVDSLLKTNHYAFAWQLIQSFTKKNSEDINALRLNAASHFYLGHYRECINLSFKILELKPNFGLAHYFIAESLNQLKYAHNDLMREFEQEYDRSDMPKEIDFLEEVFINYNECNKDLQSIIRKNAYPFKGFLKALAFSGASVYFMDFHQLMFECPDMSYSKGMRAVDYRLIDDIKGQGGYHMSSNKLQQEEEKYGKYNVAFHEFGHLIQWLFTYEQNNRLMQLFTNAKIEKRTLDWYADLNVQEYFAQGIEAYLSHKKLPGQSNTTNNTKEELKQKDPELFKFIETVINQDSYEHHIVQGLIVKSWFVDSEEKALKVLENALIEYPNNPSLIIEIANVYRDSKDYEKAIELHEKVIQEYPENLIAKLELSYDFFKEGNDINQAIHLLESQIQNPNFDARMYRFLAYYYLETKNFKEAIQYLEYAKFREPYPDPYDISIPDVYYLLGKAYMANQEFLMAKENLEISLDLNRSKVETYADLVNIHMKLKNYQEALKLIQTALSLSPTNAQLNKLKTQIENYIK